MSYSVVSINYHQEHPLPTVCEPHRLSSIGEPCQLQVTHIGTACGAVISRAQCGRFFICGMICA
jgi:hypothetical protein